MLVRRCVALSAFLLAASTVSPLSTMVWADPTPGAPCNALELLHQSAYNQDTLAAQKSLNEKWERMYPDPAVRDAHAKSPEGLAELAKLKGVETSWNNFYDACANKLYPFAASKPAPAPPSAAPSTPGNSECACTPILRT
jgi:hypothetical protein